MVAAIADWAESLKRDIGALWIAARDGRTPWRTKLLAGLIVAYALSPIDLIPDFIPVLGYLDDLILLPLGIWLAIRVTPEELMAEFRRRAIDMSLRPKSVAGLVLIATIWLIAAAGVFCWIDQRSAVTSARLIGV